MQIRITYVGTLDGVAGIWCGFKPEGAIITEERPVLYPEPDFELEHKETKERFSAVWLKDGDSQENYIEVPYEEHTPIPEIID